VTPNTFPVPELSQIPEGFSSKTQSVITKPEPIEELSNVVTGEFPSNMQWRMGQPYPGQERMIPVVKIFEIKFVYSMK
jgi:hypothetical protein